MIPVVELNRNPDNYFAEIELAAFSRRTSFPASVGHLTKCSRPASFRMPTRIAIDWVRTMKPSV
jgi:hypothetical protein